MIPTHRASRIAPNVATPARAAAVAVENLIRNQRDFETGVFFDSTGRELARVRGEPDRVTVARAFLDTMRGNTFTHNHPAGMPFSVEDIQRAVEFRFTEVRAATANFRFAACGFDGVWHGAIAVAYDESVARLSKKVMSMVLNDQIHRSHFQAELQHQAIAFTAKKLGFNYWRERS